MPNGSDGGRETSRKLPVLREDNRLKLWGSARQRGILGSSVGGKERGGNRVAWAWAGWGNRPTGSSAQAGWPGPAKATTEPGPQGASGCWLAGPAGVSAPPQGLQLVGHLLQLCLYGRQALQFLVLGKNTRVIKGLAPGAWASIVDCAARLAVWPWTRRFASLSLGPLRAMGTVTLPCWTMVHENVGGTGP